MLLRLEGCAVMRAVTALRVAAAERTKAIFSGCRSGAGGCKGPVAIWRPGRAIWSAAACGAGVGLRSPTIWLGWAGLLQFVRVCASVPTGRNSSPGLHLGAGGDGPMVTGLCAVGVCGLLGGVGVSWGTALFVAGLCGLPGVKGSGSRVIGLFVGGVCISPSKDERALPCPSTHPDLQRLHWHTTGWR